MKTLKQVADLVGMTRRVIQEYEKAGLTKTPTTTDKYGHLLYDEATIERLWQIRFYRELEYDKEQIRKAFTDPSYNKHDAIADQIVKLEEKKRRLESMIEVARTYNEMDILPSDIWVGQNGALENIPYNMWVAFAAKEIKFLVEFIEQLDWEQDIQEAFYEELSTEWPTEKAMDQWIDAVQKIGKYYATGLPYESDKVQGQVLIMQKVDAEIIPDSAVKCWLRTDILVSEGLEDYIKENFGEGGYQYITAAVEFHIKSQWIKYAENSETVGIICEILENLRRYGFDHFTTGSNEVQGEIKKLHNIISNIGLFSKCAQIELLEFFSDLSNSQEAIDAFENGRERGICWFISRAIQIYCNHQKESMEKEKESNE